MKRSLLEQVLLYDYRYIFGYGLVLAAAAYFLFWRLGSLLPGLGTDEAEYLSSFASFADVFNNPIYWPHKLVNLLATQNIGYSELTVRLVSAGFASLGLIAFFAVVRYRFRARIAIAAVALLATSSWWLGFARSARPEILLPVAVFGLMFVARKAYETRRLHWALALITLLGLSLYVPLLIYVVLVGLFALRSIILRVAKDFSPLIKYSLLGWLFVLLLPLLIAIGRDLEIGRALLGLPEHLPGIIDWLSSVSNGIAELFWSAPGENWSLRVGRLPLLDLFTAIMLALGLYHLDQEVSRSLAHFVLTGLGVLLILTRLGDNPYHSALLIPFVFMLVAAGVVMLVSQWYEIFPLNPVARMTAFLPTIVLLFSVMAYHHHRYFVTWAGAPQILDAYPPLSRYLAAELDNLNNKGSDRIFVVVSDTEVQATRVISRYNPSVSVTSVTGAVDLGEPILFSPQAFAQTDSELISQMSGKIKPISSSFSSQPISLWRYEPTLD